MSMRQMPAGVRHDSKNTTRGSSRGTHGPSLLLFPTVSSFRFLPSDRTDQMPQSRVPNTMVSPPAQASPPNPSYLPSVSGAARSGSPLGATQTVDSQSD